ncbi:MAG: MbcA/ParS/Xre antitoxin family protein [bacterium]
MKQQASNHKSPATSPGSLGRVAAKLFFAIADEWELTEEQRQTLAGTSSRTTLHTWRKKVEQGAPLKLGRDTLERLSYIAGIYKALQILLPQPRQWKEWIHKPNRDFGNQSALQHMLGGQVMDIADVRRYLDSWRGGPFA